MHELPYNPPDYGSSEGTPLFPCRPTVKHRSHSLQRKVYIGELAGLAVWLRSLHLASDRFAVAARRIRAVLEVESGGDEHSISPRGAMGLMQLMPSTWVELSARYGLGLDPFGARDNILAGTAYLKEMHDRFGSAGFPAAYHAGPWRYKQHLATGKPLPSETTAGHTIAGQRAG